MNNRIIIFIFVVSMLITASAINETSIQENIVDINEEASRLTYKIDEQGIAHFIYLTGKSPIVELAGEDNMDLSPQKMFYGIYNMITGETMTERVTLEDVFPYHYNFQIDSLGQIHTTYVSNYTLYYAVRNTNGDWLSTPLNDKMNWYAYQPDIVLGNDEEPRIIYVANYKEGAADYFGTLVQTSYRAVHYTLKNSTGWFLYDVSMNTGTSNTKKPTKFLVYNPGLMIDDGIVYVSYNVDNALGSSSNMEFLRFSENPDVEKSLGSFDDFKFPKIFEAAIRATKFRRPQIFTLNNDIIMLVGTWNTGGGIIAYLNDTTLSPIVSDTGSTTDQWEIFQIENNRRSLQIESFTGMVDKKHGEIVGVYSTYHLYNQEENLFNQDVWTISFSPSEGSIGPVKYYKISDTNNIQHTYPAVNHLDDDQVEVSWLTWDKTSNTKLVRTTVNLSTHSYGVSATQRPFGSEEDGTETSLFFNSNLFYLGILTIVWLNRREK